MNPSAIIIIKKKFLEFGFILLLALSSGQLLAYIYMIKVFKNKTNKKVVVLLYDAHGLGTNKKVVVLLYDAHGLGTKKQNIAQLELFFKTTVDICEHKGIPLDLLHESKDTYYYQRKGILKKGSFGYPKFETDFDDEKFHHLDVSIFNPQLAYSVHSSEDSNTTTWIDKELFKKFESTPYKNITLQSVDPRIVADRWTFNLNAASFRDLKDIANTEDHVCAEEYNILLKENLKLEKEIHKFDQMIDKDYDETVSTLGININKRELRLRQNIQLLENSILPKKSLEIFSKYILNHRRLYSFSLDKMALLEIARSHKLNHHSVLIAGGAHSASLEESLQTLGYQLTYQMIENEWSKRGKAFFESEVKRYQMNLPTKKEPPYEKEPLSKELEESVNQGFVEIFDNLQ